MNELKLEQLNKYIARCGICSRRKADELIKAGHITINGELVDNPAYRLTSQDKVVYKDDEIVPEKKVYVLLNKPKNCITTRSDERDRKTVIDLIEKEIKERVFPVGRLDRATTGVLLLTNDGELAQKLAHPQHLIKKIYKITVDTNFKVFDFNKLVNGIKLEDGFIKPDFAYFSGQGRDTISIGLHSGKNRIIRRMMEHLGYKVTKLDRIQYGNLTKKSLPVGKWRFLTKEELRLIVN